MKNKITKTDTKTKEFLFKKCPSCQCTEILKLEEDTVCLSCDWNSAQLDVSSGNFEKRLALNAFGAKQEKPIRVRSKILHLDTPESEATPNQEYFSLAACE